MSFLNNSSFPDNNPFLNESNQDDSPTNNLWNINISNKFISLGEKGVDKTHMLDENKKIDNKDNNAKNINKKNSANNRNIVIINNNNNNINIINNPNHNPNRIIPMVGHESDQVNNSINNNQIIPGNQNNNFNNKQFIRNPLYIPHNNLNNIINESEEITYFNQIKVVFLIGLVNLGSTSYLNSVLRFICSIKALASYYLYEKNGKFFQNSYRKISYVMHRLCYHLYPIIQPNQNEAYKPKSFFSYLGKYNVVYKDLAEKNPNELIVYLLDRLSDEYSIIQQNNNYNYNNHILPSNIYDQFEWKVKKEIECKRCNKGYYMEQKFKTFDLDIISCARLKKLDKIKLNDCLDFFIMERNKKYLCIYCKNFVQNIIKKEIDTSPKYFIFLLDLKDEKYINFVLEQKIHLKKYIKNRESPKDYELNGLVYFDVKKNKYNAFCICPVDKKWYLYDDEKVESYDLIKFLSIYNFNKFNNNYRPCILLYKSITNNNNF